MDKAKQASPLATGGAGTIMEYRFAGMAFARLLCGGTVPGLAKIDRVQLQGGPAGHNLDDVIFFGSPAKTPRIEKQVKRTVAPAPSNKEFFSVMEQCLRALDEYGADIDSGEVQLGLVATGPVGPLGQLRELTDLARAHADFATLQPILTPPVTAKSICDRYAHIKNTVALVLKNQNKTLEDAELNALTHRVLKALQVQFIEAEADSRDTQIALDELAKIVPPTLNPTDVLTHLIAIAQEIGPRAGTVTSASLRTMLAKRGIALTTDPQKKQELAALQTASVRYLKELRRTIGPT